MPKILVADDNSNIQKMVGLALKDQGIDVVAVGNGEAAVRKIADVRPDLVLADVFMPVRNGYEVCQFVKMDSALSHIPVILLVGAFDPLDEQEAQRVGADGVLKKPFIPPDPLISMVKAALQRSGAGHPGAPPRASAPEAAYGAKDMVMPGAASVPTVNGTPVPEFHVQSGPETASESLVEEVPRRPEPLHIDSSSQPVAFGSLLETPAEEPAEDSGLTPGGSPFTMERDWRDRDAEEVAEEEEEEPPAWRPEGAGDEEEVPAANARRSKSKNTGGDWRTGGFEQMAAGKSRNTAWEPEEETPAPAETAPVASSRVPGTPAVPGAPVEEPRPVSNKPPAAELWAPPVPPPAASPFPAVSSQRHSADTAAAVAEDKAKTTGGRSAGDRKDGKDPCFSVSSSPWEGEIQKANQLAATWDAPTVANPGAAPKNGNEKTNGAGQGAKAVIEAEAIPPATVEAIREEAAQVAEEATFIVEAEPVSEGSSFYAQEVEAVREPSGSAPARAPSAASNMDDLVAKVLAKMSPEVLQAVTREILKPVVEAMVKEELKTKKP